MDLDCIQGSGCRLANRLSIAGSPIGERGRGRLTPNESCLLVGGRSEIPAIIDLTDVLVTSVFLAMAIGDSTVTSKCNGGGDPGSDGVEIGEYEGLAMSSSAGEGKSLYSGLATTFLEDCQLKASLLA